MGMSSERVSLHRCPIRLDHDRNWVNEKVQVDFLSNLQRNPKNWCLGQVIGDSFASLWDHATKHCHVSILVIISAPPETSRLGLWTSASFNW